MSLMIKETAGDSLVGAIDGSNTVYTTTFDISDPSALKVYVNGILMQASVDNGYNVILPRSIVMKEPLLAVPDCPDTLEVEYRADVKTGGGALGGCPSAPVADVVEPDSMRFCEDIPDVDAANLEPTGSTVHDKPTVLNLQQLRPSMFNSEDC